MKQLYISEIAEHAGVTTRTIQRAAVLHRWPYTIKIKANLPTRQYNLNDLTPKLQIKIIASLITIELKNSLKQAKKEYHRESHRESHAVEHPQFSWLKQHIYHRDARIDPTKMTKHMARLSILGSALAFTNESNLTKIKAFDDFSELYNQLRIPLHKSIYQNINRISRISLLRWHNTIQADPHQLASLNQILTQLHFIDKKSKAFFQAIATLVVQQQPTVTALTLYQYLHCFIDQQTIPSLNLLNQWILAGQRNKVTKL